MEFSFAHSHGTAIAECRRILGIELQCGADQPIGFIQTILLQSNDAQQMGGIEMPRHLRQDALIHLGGFGGTTGLMVSDRLGQQRMDSLMMP